VEKRSISAQPGPRGRLIAPLIPALGCAALFSAAVNLLMLTGPLFMLLVYDRVLPAHSVETLVALFLIALAGFAVQAALDIARGRIMTRVAARLQSLGEDSLGSAGAIIVPARDLDMLHRAIAAPAALSLLDLPWTPLFLGAAFLLHPMLGLTALCGAVALTLAAWLHAHVSRKGVALSAEAAGRASRIAEQSRRGAETALALGMEEALHHRWRMARREARQLVVALGDRAGLASTFVRSTRLALQSALLALGAWLVIRGDISLGAMAAASIQLGRALAPVEGVVAGWQMLAQAGTAWRNLSADPQPAEDRMRMDLPPPKGHFTVDGLGIRASGSDRWLLEEISFDLPPGSILGVIGPSAAGKSTFLAALAGTLAPDKGSIRLDGAHIGQYRRRTLAAASGVLPQNLSLFDGSIARNIARMQSQFDSSAVLKAAHAAGIHETIVALPHGYDTQIRPERPPLSGGQAQRIGIARAFFGDPSILLLDEPDAALDAAGIVNLLSALRDHRDRGGTAIVVTHRPTVLAACDLILSLDAGRIRALGPRAAALSAVQGQTPQAVFTSRRGAA